MVHLGHSLSWVKALFQGYLRSPFWLMKTPCIISILGKKSTVLLPILWRRNSCFFFGSWVLLGRSWVQGIGNRWRLCNLFHFFRLLSCPPLSCLFSSLASCGVLNCSSYGNHSKPLIVYVFFSEPLLISSVVFCAGHQSGARFSRWGLIQRQMMCYALFFIPFPVIFNIQFMVLTLTEWWV